MACQFSLIQTREWNYDITTVKYGLRVGRQVTQCAYNPVFQSYVLPTSYSQIQWKETQKGKTERRVKDTVHLTEPFLCLCPVKPSSGCYQQFSSKITSHWTKKCLFCVIILCPWGFCWAFNVCQTAPELSFRKLMSRPSSLLFCGRLWFYKKKKKLWLFL